MTTPRADRETILRAFELFVAPGEIIEVRAPIRRGKTVAGYFDNRERFTTEVLRLSGQMPGVYWTVNPVQPALLARYCNRIEDYATNLTGDGDVLCRRRTPFDLDATRPAGISSTDEEHALALAAADRTITFLVDHGVPRESLLDVDSGNGAHVHLAVELPNDQASTTLVRTILAVVAARVDTERVHVDQTMFNASRIIKVPGTLAMKGDPLPERPHRLATFRTIPTRWVPVEPAVLHALAALHPSDPPHRERETYRTTGSRSAFDVRDFLAAHAVTISREKPWEGTQGRGTFLELAACVFDATHDHGEAGVIELATGMLLYRCHHNSCLTKRWEDVRRQLDPARAHARHRTDDAPPEWEPGRDSAARAHARSRRRPDADAPEPPPSTFIAVEQLLNEPTVPVRWLVDGLLPAAGLSLLVAKPKVGKSTLARALAAAVAAGQPILGRPSAQGPVLYVALEDHRDDVKAHMKLLKPPTAAPLFLHIGAPPSTDPVAWLRSATATHTPVLVVIDSLGRFLRVADFNDYAQVTRATGPVIALAREGGVHVLCVHHAGKASDRLAIDTSLGSTALTGFVDTILVERRYADGSRTLESIQRVGRDLPETVVAFDAVTGTVGAAGDLDAYRIRQLVAEIVAALATTAHTEEEIRTLLDRDRRLVSKALRQALADGRIVRSGAGKKGDPYLYALAPAANPGETPRSEKAESSGDPSGEERPGCKPPGNSSGESGKSSLTPIGKPEARKRESEGGETLDPGAAAALAAFPGATVVGCPQCGGTAWRPNLAGDGEYCLTCTAASPLTRSLRDPGEEG